MLTGLMVAGRVGSGIAAELGSMMVTDQIAALRALGTDPIRKLVRAAHPRRPGHGADADRHRRARSAWSAAGSSPSTLLRVASSVYWNSVVQGLYIQDVWMGLIKPFFLGFAIVSIGCHVGLRTTRRHAGRRPRDDQRRRGQLGGGDRRRLPGHAAAHRADVLMARAQPAPRPALLDEALGPGGPIIVFDDVHLAFDEKVILRDVSFTLKTGHTKIFLGASGAGKSTILRLILGLLKPDGGQHLRQRRAGRQHDRGRA